MLRTRVGYAGGSTPDPTYREIGDHTEVFQVDFDPKVISFGELLEVFWESHGPCAPVRSTQYKAVLFHHDEAQRALAEASAQARQEQLGRPITTELRALERFYLAEEYHQKYALRRHPSVVRDLLVLAPRDTALVGSIAAAKLNAYFAGHLSFEGLERALKELDLRVEGGERVTGVCRMRAPAVREARGASS